ncbi:MAG: DNA polymerase IV [Candidatus Bathyarchaeota archaeon]|nr:DNA polymerase IV [Candidatus Bathyarchaeota archaeon]
MKGSCSEKQRTVLHVDMDHFFSAVEEREHPEFEGKPVVVGADPQKGGGRGVVKTCNYEAREFGIHSGMPISKAWRLCPKAVYVRGNYPLYKEASNRIMAILGKYSGKFQRWGLDEAFLDVSSDVQNLEEAVELAARIKHELLWNEQLTCSIGIAPNKLVAKIASDYKKPDGLTVVSEDSVERFLAPLPVQRMLWIGEKTGRKLNAMGIKTIGDLASFDVRVLIQRFGVMGLRYHKYARGIHKAEVGRTGGTRKSLGHESTFSTDTNDCACIFQRLNDLCQRIHERVVRHKLLFKTVTVKIRFQNFETHTYGKTLPLFTSRLQDLQKATQKLVQDHFAEGNKKLRLVGVRVSNLKFVGEQETL